MDESPGLIVDKELGKIFNGNTLTVDRSSRKPRDTGLSKIVWAAAQMNPRNKGSTGLAAFRMREMDPETFRELLKRTLSISLTRDELREMVDYFDPDMNGYVTTSDFLSRFFKMGGIEKQAQDKWRVEKAKKMCQKEAVIERRRTKKRELLTQAITPQTKFTERDRESALNKLGQASLLYMRDRTRVPGFAEMKGFRVKSLQPLEFRDLLKKSLQLQLTNREIVALIDEIADDPHKDGSGLVDGATFMAFFLRLGRSMHNDEIAEAKLELRKKKLRQQISEMRIREDEAFQKEIQLLDWSQADLQSALQKLRDVAARYDRRALGPAQLEAFSANGMTPEVFARQLSRTFGIRLTMRERSALVSHLDADGDGLVSKTDFMAHFFKTKVKSAFDAPIVLNRELHGTSGGGGTITPLNATHTYTDRRIRFYMDRHMTA